MYNLGLGLNWFSIYDGKWGGGVGVKGYVEKAQAG